VRRTSRLQVVEQRCVAGASGTSKQLLAFGEITLGNLDHAASEFLAGAPGTVSSCRLT